MINAMRKHLETELPVGSRIEAGAHWVELYARASLPTRFGEFAIHAFRHSDGPLDHVALVRGTPDPERPTAVRMHSECLTGDVLGSLRCDCRDQLELALAHLAGAESAGILLYLRQEGRGIGLGNKIRAYALQEQGLDTCEANLALGYAADDRSYVTAALILRMLGCPQVTLLTNNPAKVEALMAAGVHVVGRVPLTPSVTQHNRNYLRTKVGKLGHILDLID